MSVHVKIQNFKTRVVAWTTAERKAVLASYLPDWAVTVVLFVVFCSLENVCGHKRDFSLTDTSLMHPLVDHERVPIYALYQIGVVFPLLFMWIVNLLFVRSWRDTHHGTIGFFLGHAITRVLTYLIKVTAGRPRPDLLARCNPPSGATDPPFGLTTVDICRPRDWFTIYYGFQSFPSGHASLAFAGLVFLSLWLAGKMHLFDKKGYAIKAWIAFIPLAAASLVAISRTMDYRNHAGDVIAGSLLGTVIAYFAYRLYYPPLDSLTCGVPYESRMYTDSEILPTHAGKDRSVNA